MANWTLEGFVGQLFRTIGKHVPPPPIMASPPKWGDEATVRERLKDGVAELSLTRRMYPFSYRSRGQPGSENYILRFR